MGVGGRPSPVGRAFVHHSGGWVCTLGSVRVSSIFGLVRGTGSFTPVLPTLVLVSRIHLAQQYRDFEHFLSAASCSRLKTMVGGALVKTSAFRFGLGVSGATIVSGSCRRPSKSWMSCLLTHSWVFSLALGFSIYIKQLYLSVYDSRDDVSEHVDSPSPPSSLTHVHRFIGSRNMWDV